MSEKRKKSASFCLKIGAKSSKGEIFGAEQWPDGRPGTVRLRVNGCWLDGRSGEHSYYDASGLAEVLTRMLTDDILPEPCQAPLYAKNQRVSLPTGPKDDDGMPLFTELGTILNAMPLLGRDNRWHVLVHSPSNSFCLMPCDDVRILDRKNGSQDHER